MGPTTIRHKALRAFLTAICISALLSAPVRAEGTPTIETVSISASIGSSGELIALGDTYIFAADDGVHGQELWTSDGTAAGTKLIDICPGTCWSRPHSFVRMNGFVYFFARSEDHGASDIWRTDGTRDGTVRAVFIFNQTDDLYVAGDTMYWAARSAEYNLMWLYKSDGTQEGTHVVYTFREDWSNPDSICGASEIVNVGSRIFFAARGLFDSKGVELWRSDSTFSGTKIVKDIRAGTRSSCPDNLFVLGNDIYFTVQEVGKTPFELWKSNGTAAGTVRVKSFAAGEGIGCFTGAGRILYFASNDGIHGWELWRSNGTLTGTKIVKDVNTNGDVAPCPYAVGTKLYFYADDGIHGAEPWQSDGTAAGTKMITDVNVGIAGSLPDDEQFLGGFVSLGSWIYFVADNGSKRTVYRTRDGVTEPISFTDDALGVSVLNSKLSVLFETQVSFIEVLEKAVSYTRPSVKVSRKNAVGGILIANRGVWGGLPAPTFNYQWYSCGTRLLIPTRNVPSGCESISGATAATLTLTSAERNRYIAVLVTATSAGTSPTQWLSKTTATKVSN